MLNRSFIDPFNFADLVSIAISYKEMDGWTTNDEGFVFSRMYVTEPEQSNSY